MTSSYDVIKLFNFFDNFDIIFHYKKLFFVKNTTSFLNCKVYAFKKPKQSAIIFYSSPTKRLLKTLGFLTKTANFEIFW